MLILHFEEKKTPGNICMYNIISKCFAGFLNGVCLVATADFENINIASISNTNVVSSNQNPRPVFLTPYHEREASLTTKFHNN